MLQRETQRGTWPGARKGLYIVFKINFFMIRQDGKFPNFPFPFFPTSFRFPILPFPFIPFLFLPFPFFRFPSIRIPVGTVSNIENWQSYNRSIANLNLSILQHLSIRSPWYDPINYLLTYYQITDLTECLKTAHHRTSPHITAHQLHINRTSPVYGHNCTSQHLYKLTNSRTCVLNSSVQCRPIVPACHTTHHAWQRTQTVGFGVF